MDLEAWAAIAARHRRVIILIGLLTTFAGVALIIDQPEATVLRWLAVPLLVGGATVFAWSLLPRHWPSVETSPSIASRLLQRLTKQGRFVSVFPVLGIAVVLADLGYNLTLSATPALQTEDIIVLLAAAAFIAYPAVPAPFSRERDFVLVFFICLNAVLVVPLLVARAYAADFERSVDVYSWVALAPQMSAVLSLLGVANSVHPVAGSTAPGLTFVPQHFPVQVTVVITTACSGIYSFGIFASAFSAFVLTEYEKLTKKVWSLVGLGFLTSYLANVFRMVAIVLVGYYTDTAQSDLQNMLIAHSYAGWLIFLSWIAVFWSIVLKVLPVPSIRAKETPGTRSTRVPEARCVLCNGTLTPAVPAMRCFCGAFHHRKCFDASSACPVCGRSGEERTAPISAMLETSE
jgi:exosortase/archaeosortase family protein